MPKSDTLEPTVVANEYVSDSLTRKTEKAECGPPLRQGCKIAYPAKRPTYQKQGKKKIIYNSHHKWLISPTEVAIYLPLYLKTPKTTEKIGKRAQRKGNI